MLLLITMNVIVTSLPSATIQEPAVGQDVPVTIKELDVQGAIREFKSFQVKLSEYREDISEGRSIAKETAQILEELRGTASADNDFNEGPILEAVTGYVDGVVQKQIDLVDFLESQRYRISYYANKMASSVGPKDLALLFGTVEQNTQAITSRVKGVDDVRRALADFIDSLPPEQFDKRSFRASREMPRETRRKLDVLLYGYQQERNALDLAKKRLQMVRAAQRNGDGGTSATLDVDADLLVGQMFGALDRIRLQMSFDLLYLEHLFGEYSRSARTQEILEAFHSLIEMQGDHEGPSPELANVLDWLQDSSTRRLTLSAAGLPRDGLQVPRASDLMREAYEGARGNDR